MLIAAARLQHIALRNINHRQRLLARVAFANGGRKGFAMPLAIFALTIAAYAIGTTEFVIVGLLPTV
ncbi:hypothetical protein, partial [Sinorhizobium meliloti]|uniref:hypothetical protein n=1 Tax=Rhizobium meliloti TaxID=382 RepID=UPI000FE04E4E